MRVELPRHLEVIRLRDIGRYKHALTRCTPMVTLVRASTFVGMLITKPHPVITRIFILVHTRLIRMATEFGFQSEAEIVVVSRLFSDSGLCVPLRSALFQ
jgi:hypothetical protein